MKTFNYSIITIALFLSLSVGASGQTAVATRGLRVVMRESLQKGAKEASQKAVKETVEKSVKEAAERASREVTERFAREGSQSVGSRTASRQAREEIMESLEKRGTKVAIEESGERLSRKAGVDAVKELGSGNGTTAIGRSVVGSIERREATEEALEKKMRNAIGDGSGKVASQAAKKVGKTRIGREALEELDDIPAVKRQIMELNQTSPAYYNMDNLAVTKTERGRIIEFRGTNSSIEIDGNVIKAKGGGRSHMGPDGKPVVLGKEGDLNGFLNNPRANTTYSLEDGHLNIRTGANGETISTECHSSALKKRMEQNGTHRGIPDTKNQKKIVESKGGTSGVHDGGHLQRRETGGVNESINQLPMKKEMQRPGSKWYEMEQKELDAIKRGDDVWSRKNITYNADGSYRIDVELTINGQSERFVFDDLF